MMIAATPGTPSRSMQRPTRNARAWCRGFVLCCLAAFMWANGTLIPPVLTPDHAICEQPCSSPFPVEDHVKVSKAEKIDLVAPARKRRCISHAVPVALVAPLAARRPSASPAPAVGPLHPDGSGVPLRC